MSSFLKSFNKVPLFFEANLLVSPGQIHLFSQAFPGGGFVQDLSRAVPQVLQMPQQLLHPQKLQDVTESGGDKSVLLGVSWGYDINI